MNNWIILSKLTIIIYFVLLSISNTPTVFSNIVLSLLALLIYISVNMLNYIMKSIQWRRVLLSASILILIYSSIYINSGLFYLIPFNLLELVFSTVKSKLISAALVASTVVLVDKTVFNEYIIISILSMLIFFLAVDKFEKIDNLTKEVDNLREMNNNLYMRLSKNAEYERQMMYMSQLEERNKIAQEIHDKIGHTIAGSLLQLEASKILMHNNVEKSLEIVQKVIDVLRMGMEDIRFTLRSIKPPPEQLGINRIKLLVEDSFKDSSISTKVLYTGNLDYISGFQWKVILENTSEAITNIIKYSKATLVTVNIEVLNKFIKFEVKDNGMGVMKLKKGIGIQGIEERTQGAGGKVIIDGSNGFSIITLLPIKGE